ncbi:MAG TPA: hypothetical protein VFU12_11360 [Glycomyces sp.]|nr:hypothetical protein [Glycomyces sp.]
MNISDHAYKQLKDAAEREKTTLANFARPAIEKAAYAASLAKYAPKDGGPYQYDEEALTEHHADVTRLVYGDDA